jgi:hypothetical protein
MSKKPMRNRLNLLTKLKGPRINWKYILIVIILAFIIGGMILSYYRWKEKKKPFYSGSQLKEEKSEKKEIEESEEKEEKTLLTEKNMDEIWEKYCAPEVFSAICYEFNHDPPTTEISYINREKGISLKIPYNPDWGNEKIKISPYFSYEDRVEFGFLRFDPEAHGWKRAYVMYFKPQRSLEEAFANIMKEAHPLNEFFVEGIPKERIVKGKINNHEIVKYEILTSLAGYDIFVVEVIGKKYNYEFQSQYPISEDLIKTIEFVE